MGFMNDLEGSIDFAPLGANFAGSWGWKRRLRVIALLTLFRVSPTAGTAISQAMVGSFGGELAGGGARVVNWRLWAAKTPQAYSSGRLLELEIVGK